MNSILFKYGETCNNNIIIIMGKSRPLHVTAEFKANVILQNTFAVKMALCYYKISSPINDMYLKHGKHTPGHLQP